MRLCSITSQLIPLSSSRTLFQVVTRPSFPHPIFSVNVPPNLPHPSHQLNLSFVCDGFWCSLIMIFSLIGMRLAKSYGQTPDRGKNHSKRRCQQWLQQIKETGNPYKKIKMSRFQVSLWRFEKDLARGNPKATGHTENGIEFDRVCITCSTFDQQTHAWKNQVI